MKRIDPSNLDADMAAALAIYETSADDCDKDEILACQIDEEFVVMNPAGLPNSTHGAGDWLVIGSQGAGACWGSSFENWYTKGGPHREWMRRYAPLAYQGADPT